MYLRQEITRRMHIETILPDVPRTYEIYQTIKRENSI